jgi:hypothetical protein
MSRGAVGGVIAKRARSVGLYPPEIGQIGDDSTRWKHLKTKDYERIDPVRNRSILDDNECGLGAPEGQELGAEGSRYEGEWLGGGGWCVCPRFQALSKVVGHSEGRGEIEEETGVCRLPTLVW